MKLVKKLLVLAAAMAMTLSLVACGGGDKYPQTYEYKVDWAEGTRGEVATLTLNEDNTYEYTYVATDSKDSSKEVMNCKVTGTYERTDNTVTITLGEIKCVALNGDQEIDMSSETGYKLTYAQGATTFELDGDTFVPVG